MARTGPLKSQGETPKMRQRIKSLAWARYKGEVREPVPAAIGYFGLIAVWLRNIWRTG
jgi:hypothetical protein